jgi:hypothetical protein
VGTRKDILEIYKNTKLPKEVKEYLKEEIDYFDSQGIEFWENISKETVDPSNPNNILIFYLLRLADKPKEYNHSYEMQDPPDIDADLESEGRDKVIKYLKEKYGSNRVLQIGTIGQLKIKSAIQDIARVLEIDPTDVYEVTTSLEGLDESATLEELKRTYPKLKSFLSEYPEIEKHLHRLLGSFRQYCLAGDSLIYVENFYTRNKEYIPISELVGSREHYVVSLNKDGDIFETENFVCEEMEEDTIYEVEMENGKTLRCNEEHTWFTNQGLKKIKDFKADTKILYRKN